MAENPEPLGPIKKPLNLDNRIPVGGTVDQVLKKVSETDYDVEWADSSNTTNDTDVLAYIIAYG